jgi:hypothetical protein
MKDFYISNFEKELQKNNINFYDVETFAIDHQYIIFTMKNKEQKTFFVNI